LHEPDDAADDRTRAEQHELDNKCDHQNRDDDEDDCHDLHGVSFLSRFCV